MNLLFTLIIFSLLISCGPKGETPSQLCKNGSPTTQNGAKLNLQLECYNLPLRVKYTNPNNTEIDNLILLNCLRLIHELQKCNNLKP